MLRRHGQPRGRCPELVYKQRLDERMPTSGAGKDPGDRAFAPARLTDEDAETRGKQRTPALGRTDGRAPPLTPQTFQSTSLPDTRIET